MNSITRLTNEELYSYIQKLLKTKGSPYSPEAEEKTENFMLDYGQDLAIEAAQLARREGAQQISITYVEVAKERLRSIERRNWKKKLYGQVGGVFLGVGFSTCVSYFLNSSQPFTLTLIICVVSLPIGAGLLVLDALT